MFARTVAILTCLLVTASCFAGGATANRKGRELVVFLKTDPSQPDQTIEEMKNEAGSLLGAAGYTVSWRDLGSANRDAGDAPLVVLEMRGVCQVPRQATGIETLEAGSSLASTAVAGGEVLPYSWLECGSLTRLLAPFLVQEPADRGNFLYGRAMGRLAAHEVFHALLKTSDHDATGVAKRSFSARDVLADHFEFEPGTVDRLQAANSLAKGDENVDNSAAGR